MPDRGIGIRRHVNCFGVIDTITAETIVTLFHLDEIEIRL